MPADDQVARIKYAILGRQRWLELVGELLWLRRQEDDWLYWLREDGWAIGDDDVQQYRGSLLAFHALDDLDPRHQYQWSVDRTWHFYDEAIATGDLQYIAWQGLTRVDEGRWPFC